MNKAIQLAAGMSAAVLLTLATATACKKPPVAPEPAPELARAPLGPYIGLWEGATRKGETCTIRFTATEWECHLESGGIARPYYKGTYSHVGSRVDLQITQEGDVMTMGWVPQKGNLGPGLAGRLTGGKLVVQALTDAELVRKR